MVNQIFEMGIFLISSEVLKKYQPSLAVQLALAESDSDSGDSSDSDNWDFTALIAQVYNLIYFLNVNFLVRLRTIQITNNSLLWLF